MQLVGDARRAFYFKLAVALGVICLSSEFRIASEALFSRIYSAKLVGYNSTVADAANASMQRKLFAKLAYQKLVYIAENQDRVGRFRFFYNRFIVFGKSDVVKSEFSFKFALYRFQYSISIIKSNVRIFICKCKYFVNHNNSFWSFAHSLNSKLSLSAVQLASITSVETPTVVQLLLPSVEVIRTRTFAPVAAAKSKTRTL